MFQHQPLNQKNGTKKILSSLLLTVFFVYTILAIIPSKVQAAYSEKFKNYPGYEALLKDLQLAHPNWEFEILETGLEWTDVIKNETTASHGRNVIYKNYGEWNCKTCGNKQYETGWYCASEMTVAYYMDPRNSLFEDYIFQFEQLTFDSSIQTEDGVKLIIADCNYLQGKMQYYDTKTKKKVTMDKTYVDAIMEAAKQYNVSPYHLASRIRQEQGTGNGTEMITGTWNGKEGTLQGYYNYYNIKTYGETTVDIINNGLDYAKIKGWTTPEKAILGGAEFLANDYIMQQQDTLYLQKFHVVGGNSLYWHQYMTNVSAVKSEAEEIREGYRKMGLLAKDTKVKFKIPVYKNMPESRCPMPGLSTIVTENVEVNKDKVTVRSNKELADSVIATLSKGTKLLRIELNSEKDKEEIYWDKVVVGNNSETKIGYISRDNITKIADMTNANEKYIVSSYTNFRNGPGTQNTTIIKLLSPGQMLTVIEKDKYKNVNQEDWYRVKLSDGTQGYVGTGYIEVYDENNSTYDRVKVVCTDGINIRKEPSTSSAILKAVAEGTILTRTQKNASTKDGYIWDKVTTSSGIVGYVVREDPQTKKKWIEPLTASNNDNQNAQEPEKQETSKTPSTEEPTKVIIGSGFKMNEKSLTCEPNITVEAIKKVTTDIVVKDAKGKQVTSGKVGTGWTITYQNKTYTIVVMGDADGDGTITASDYVRIKNYLRKKETLNEAQKSGADANGDGTITASDYVKVKNFLRKKETIKIK